MAHYISKIGFECPKCGERFAQAINVPETYWAGDNADERSTTDTDTVICENCSEAFDIEILNSDNSIYVTVDNYPRLKVNSSDAELVGTPYDDEYDWEADLPSEPENEFLTMLNELRQLLDKNGSDSSPSVFNRMIFSQQFAGMEAYLGDTLLMQVTSNRSVLAKMVAGNEDLKDLKLGLQNILADPDVVKKVVVTNLKSQLYHNLPKVNELYKVAFGSGIFPTIDIKNRLCKSMSLRHDCVHRNGKDKENNKRDEPMVAYIQQMEIDLRDLVRHVENIVCLAVNPLTTETVDSDLITTVRLEDI